MDEQTTQFLDVFRTFMQIVISEQPPEPTDEAALMPLLQAHLGTDPRQIPVVSEDVPVYRFVDLDIALSQVEQLNTQHQLVGIGGGEQRRHYSLSELLEGAGRFGQFGIGPVDYRSVATGPDATREVVAFGLRLFTYDGHPVAVLQRAADPRSGESPWPAVPTATVCQREPTWI